MAKVLKKALLDGVKMLQERYGMTAQKVQKAISGLKAISMNDPSEAQWQEGDVFYIPENLDECLILNTNLPASNRFPDGIPGFAVTTADGRAKVLYISTLTKSAFKYEQTEDGYQMVRENGVAAQVHADDSNEIRHLCLTSPTFGAVADKMKGHWVKVSKILGPVTTAIFKARTPEEIARRERAQVIGLRETTVPVFEFLTPEEVEKLDVYEDDKKGDKKNKKTA